MDAVSDWDEGRSKTRIVDLYSSSTLTLALSQRERELDRRVFKF